MSDLESSAPGSRVPVERRPIVGALLKAVVSIGLIVALVYWVDWASVKTIVARARPTVLLVALACIAPTVLLWAWRWACCARAFSISLPRHFYVRATYSALFVGQFLPAGVGADAARLAYLIHARTRLGLALQSLVLDRVVGVVSVIVVMAAGLPVIWERLPTILKLFTVALICGTAAAVAVVALVGRIKWITSYAGEGKRRRLLDLVLGVRAGFASLAVLQAITINCVVYCLLILGVYFIAAALGIEVLYPSLLAVVSIAMFVSLLPISVNGWGVRESAMVTGLAALGVAREPALAISLLFGFANAIVTLPGVLAWHPGRKQPHATEFESKRTPP